MVWIPGWGSFTNLPGGVYTVTVKDAGGCQTTATVTVLNNNGPILSFAGTRRNVAATMEQSRPPSPAEQLRIASFINRGATGPTISLPVYQPEPIP